MSGFTTRTIKLGGSAGPAKWIAVVALAMASGAGLTWGLTRRAPEEPVIRRAEPVPVVVSQPPTIVPFVPPRRAVGPETPNVDAAPEATARLAAPAVAPSVTPPAPEPRLTQDTSGPRKLNLNTATAAELELLPGVGPAMAKRILDYRASIGKFKSITDLDKVRGIGPKTFDKIRPLVVVEQIGEGCHHSPPRRRDGDVCNRPTPLRREGGKTGRNRKGGEWWHPPDRYPRSFTTIFATSAPSPSTDACCLTSLSRPSSPSAS